MRRAPVAHEPRPTADFYPLGTLVMTPRVDNSLTPLRVIRKSCGMLIVQPPGEAPQEISPLQRGVGPVTQAALAALNLDLPGHKPIEEMVKTGDVAKLRKTLSGLDETHRLALMVRLPKQKTTLLHIAAGHIEDNVTERVTIKMLRLILDSLRGFKLADALDEGKQTPLFDAVCDARADFSEDMQMEHVKMLLEHEKKLMGNNLFVNQPDIYGQTALMTIVKNVANSILVEENVGENEEEIICWIKMAKFLVDNGANVRLADHAGWTVVHHCIPEDVSQLRKKARVSMTRMMRLAELLQFLIGAKCPVDAKDNDGATALFWAVNFADDKLAPLIQVLARNGANPAALVRNPGRSPGNTPILAAQRFAAVSHGVPMTKILEILQKTSQERKALAPVTAEGAFPVGPPSRAQAPLVKRRRILESSSTGRGGSMAANTSTNATGADGNDMVTVQLLRADAAEIFRIIERPTLELTQADFCRHDCFMKQKLQLRDDNVNRAFEATIRAYQLSQMQAPRFRIPEISIVRCYGVSGGSNILPPYRSGAYHYLHKSLEHFFEEPWFDMPSTTLKVVPDDDPREALRGQATVYAQKDFGPWEIIGAYTGCVMTQATLAARYSSLLVRNRVDDYVMQMCTPVKVDGEMEQLIICPYPSFGNESMAINDGKQDKKRVNCGWMEAKYRGWPYVFVVVLRAGIKCGEELLLDYSDGAYWESKRQMEFEQSGLLDALESEAIDRVRNAYGNALQR